MISTAFSPDGRRVTTASEDSTARLWDARSGDLLHVLGGHTERVVSAPFSPDGRLVATVSHDATVRLWDVEGGNVQSVLRGHGGPVTDAVFRSDGDAILTASSDRTARVWGVKDGSTLFALEGHNDRVNAAMFSPDSRSIVTASYDRTAKIWRFGHGTLLHELVRRDDKLDRTQNRVNGLLFSPDGRLVVTATYHNLEVWDARSGEHLHTLQGGQGIVYLSFSPNDGRLLAVWYGGTVLLWDPDDPNAPNVRDLTNCNVEGAAFGPHGSRVVTLPHEASKEGTLQVWDAEHGTLLCTLPGPGRLASFESLSPRGDSILVAHYDNVARLWDVESGQQISTLEGFVGSTFDASFSSDGRRIALGLGDHTARLWDVESGRLLHILRGHDDLVGAVAFRADDLMLATGSHDNTARLWDVESGRLLDTLRGHTDVVNHLQFSPDGHFLATSSVDGTARLWDVASGTLLHVLRGHRDTVSFASFSPDGRWLGTASEDGSARLWDLDVPLRTDSGLIPLWAEAFTGTALVGANDYRGLTIEEWQDRLRRLSVATAVGASEGVIPPRVAQGIAILLFWIVYWLVLVPWRRLRVLIGRGAWVSLVLFDLLASACWGLISGPLWEVGGRSLPSVLEKFLIIAALLGIAALCGHLQDRIGRLRVPGEWAEREAGRSGRELPVVNLTPEPVETGRVLRL